MVVLMLDQGRFLSPHKDNLDVKDTPIRGDASTEHIQQERSPDLFGD